MRKICCILVLVLLLSGCAAEETFETLGDVDMAPVVQQARQLQVTIPETAEILQGSSGTLYLCDGYTLTVEVLSAGNISGTMQTLTGFGTDDLTVIETAAGGYSRYECVWTAAGEGGDTLGRVMVLDDGAFHYCVAMHYSAEDASGMQEVWKEIADSVTLG